MSGKIRTQEVIPIFMSAGKTILEPTSVAIVSILANTKSYIKFYILMNTQDAFSEKDKKKLASIKRKFKNFEINYIDIDPVKFQHLNLSVVGYVKIDTYFRFLIPELDKNIDKAIYLDCDIIALKDISELYNEDLGDKEIGVICKEKGKYLTDYMKRVIAKTKIKDPETYFNAGVLLLNCKLMRENKTSEKLFKNARDWNDIIDFADQDVLNITFEGKYKELDCKYNEYSFRIDNLDNVNIIHYVGKLKPWLLDCDYFIDFWYYAKKYSPFYEELLQIRYNYTPKERLFFVRNIYNNHLLVSLLGFRFRLKKDVLNKLFSFKSTPQRKIYKILGVKFSFKKRLPKPRKTKVYFLLHSKAFLPSWKSFLEACKKDDRIISKVIYCPPKKPDEAWKAQFDGTEEWLKENNIDYIHYNKINLLLDRPDILFFQTPYDIYHRTEKNNSTYFKKWGINSAYISYGLEFTESALSIENHFKLDLHKSAYRIYTFSKNLVDDYGKYCPIGNSHLRCFGHPKFDNLLEAKNIPMPEWLKEKAKGRKIICWHTHFPCKYSDENGTPRLSTLSWDEDKKILDYIKNDKEYFYIFMPHHLFYDLTVELYNMSPNEVKIFKKELINGENSIVWEGEYPEVLNWSDIFMGERSAVTMEMITTNKPVIYLEGYPEIYNEFGKDVLNAYYYANNANEAIKQLELIKSGNDPKQEQRQKVFEKYIAPYWDGKCGERIKEDIIESNEEIKNIFIVNFFLYIKVFALDLFKKFFDIRLVRRKAATHAVIKVLGIKLKVRL